MSKVAGKQYDLSGGLDYWIGSAQGSILYRDASAWKVLSPGAAGQVLQSGGSAANPSWVAPGSAFDDGCCRLSVTSATALKLSALNGNTLWVGGQASTIPAAGITLSGPSVSASTLYYVYATASGGAVNALTLSTTSHITGADGREYLSSGGATPSAVTTSRLVGMVYTNGSGQFIDSVSWRGLLNWFTQRPRTLNFNTNGVQSSQQTFGLIGSTAPILTWGANRLSVRVSGWYSNAVSGQALVAGPYIDGSSLGYAVQADETVANGRIPYASEAVVDLPSEGVHNVGLGGNVTGNTGTFYAGIFAETMG